MKTKNMIITALLLAIGMVLHFITPPVYGGIKPDFLLSCMFIAILIQDDFSNALAAGLTAGIMSAMTTSFPGGQIPNLVEKLITAVFVFILVKKIYKNHINTMKLILLAGVGTFVSGVLFLSFAYILVGLPAPFYALLVVGVLPAIISNIVASLAIYRAFISIKKSRII